MPRLSLLALLVLFAVVCAAHAPGAGCAAEGAQSGTCGCVDAFHTRHLSSAQLRPRMRSWDAVDGGNSRGAASAASAEAEAPFVSTWLHSGLGNQLFQLARAYGYAELCSGRAGVWVRAAELNPHAAAGTAAAGNYHRTVFAKLARIDVEPDYVSEEPEVATNVYLPGPACEPQRRHVHFRGYYQHERYLPRDRAAFLAALQLPRAAPMHRTAFIHVRRGDTVGHHMTDVGLTESGYYEAAIALIRENHGSDVSFLVFSDDVEWCKASPLFAGPAFAFAVEPDEVSALMSMAACMLGGVAANSTFSWWGAFLNESGNKTVVFPGSWYSASSGRVSDTPFRGSYVLHVNAADSTTSVRFVT